MSVSSESPAIDSPALFTLFPASPLSRVKEYPGQNKLGQKKKKTGRPEMYFLKRKKINLATAAAARERTNFEMLLQDEQVN